MFSSAFKIISVHFHTPENTWQFTWNWERTCWCKQEADCVVAWLKYILRTRNNIGDKLRAGISCLGPMIRCNCFWHFVFSGDSWLRNDNDQEVNACDQKRNWLNSVTTAASRHALNSVVLPYFLHGTCTCEYKCPSETLLNFCRLPPPDLPA